MCYVFMSQTILFLSNPLEYVNITLPKYGCRKEGYLSFYVGELEITIKELDERMSYDEDGGEEAYFGSYFEEEIKFSFHTPL